MKKTIASLILIIFGLAGFVCGQGNSKNQDNLDSRLSNLVQQISDGLSENQKQKVAVVEFADLKGNTTDFGRYLAEELITRLYQTKKFKVIERNLLNKIIAEQKLSLTGVIEPTSAHKLGKLLGVDAICSGSVSDLGKSFKVNARLINTETAEVFSVASIEIIKDDTVCALGDCKLSSNDTSKDDSNPGLSKPVKAVGRNITFELNKCVRKNTSAVCEILVTNNNEERKFSVSGGFYTSIRVFDDENNEHHATWGQIANRPKREWDEIRLVTDIPAKIQINFDNIDSKTTKLTLLELAFKDNNDFSKVQFRNVPLTDK